MRKTRKMRKTWLALLVLVSLLVIGTSLYAYGMRGSCHGTRQGHMGKTCDMSNVPNKTSTKCDSCQVNCDMHRVDSGKSCYGCH